MIPSRTFLLAVTVVLASVGLPHRASAVRILGVFTSITRSHVICYESLAKALAARGHQVTVISSQPQAKPLANYTDIDVPYTTFGLDRIVRDASGIQNFHGSIAVNTHLITMLIRLCQYFLENEKVQELIHSKNVDFDILIIEVEMPECFLGFAHKFPNAHLIGIYAQSAPHHVLDIVGNPSPYAYTPFIQHMYSNQMTLLARISNTISITSVKIAKKFILLPIQDYLMRKYFTDMISPLPYITKIQSKMALLLLNNDVNLSFSRPYLPNVIEVGGMHIKPPKRLPHDLQTFLDNATDGVVYFSLGSLLGNLHMPESQRQAFIEAFSTLKQRVIWVCKENITGLSANVRLGQWMPQNDILAHPNVRVFLSHGGNLGMQEAVYNGVPMVGIPINADQFMNVMKIEELGFGIQLEFSNITTHSLQWALDELIFEPRYRKKAKELSARFRDGLMTPLQRAVYWTEYIHKHNGAPHLQSAAINLAWYQYFMLDAIALLVLAAGLLVLVLYVTSRMVITITQGIITKPTKKVIGVQKKVKKKNNY